MIGKVISHSFEKDSSYHLPVRAVTSRDDVKYDPDVMHKARWAIAGHVKGGHPVLVGCAMNPQTSMLKDGHLQATRDGGHTVLIVGYNETAEEFLYVDPYPGGSTLHYKPAFARCGGDFERVEDGSRLEFSVLSRAHRGSNGGPDG